MAYDSPDNENSKLRTNRTLICSVVFLDIVEYSKKPVVEQMNLKERFNAILAENLKDIPVSDRIILDTGDGAAIGFLGDPEDALFVAMSLRDALSSEGQKSDMRVRMGINLGPVKILKDINNQMNLIGDGINVAQRIMSFAEEGQLLVSRSYYDIVSCLSQEYAQLFQYRGARADKHIREHDIYSVENTGLRPTSASHHPENIIKPDFTKNEPPHATQTEPPLEVVAGPLLNKGAKKKSTKNYLIISISLIAILIIVIGFLIFKIQDKSTFPTTLTKLSTKEAKDVRATEKATARKKAESIRSTEKTGEAETGGTEETFKPSSMKADGIEFTTTGTKRSGEAVTITIHMHNTDKIAKSVALYDDYVSWPKSQLIDQAGRSYEVNKVVFVKGSQTLTSQASGREGLMLNPGQKATVSLSFRKTGKGVNRFALHPFIYVGRSWKEHDLAMKVGL